MGNTHSSSSSQYPGGGKARKNVHWKAAECPSPPGKPDIVTGATGDEGIRLRWLPPRYDGGAPLLGFHVELHRIGTPTWERTTQRPVPRPEVQLAGLEPGKYQFRVMAENAAGCSSHSEISDMLCLSRDGTVVAPPKFVGPLSDVDAVENEKTEFRVFFEGSPQPEICWFKDGCEIFSSRRTTISTDAHTSCLIFHQTSLSDEGEIECTATNRAGRSVTRARLLLRAAPALRPPRRYEDGLLYDTNETIFLKVSVAGKPTPDIHWWHDGTPILPSERVEIVNTEKFSSVKIANATRNDRGEYRVVAENSIGEDAASFLVTITAKPDPPKKVTVTRNADGSVTLTWLPPDDDGGCQVSNYIIEYYRSGWDMWLKAMGSRKLSAVLNELIEGSEYKFRIKAESPYGLSEPSAETPAIYLPIDEDKSLNEIERNRIEIPRVTPRRKRQASPRIEEEGPAQTYTLDIRVSSPTLKRQKSFDKETVPEAQEVIVRDVPIPKFHIIAPSLDEPSQSISKESSIEEKPQKEDNPIEERLKSDEYSSMKMNDYTDFKSNKRTKSEEKMRVDSSEFMLVLCPTDNDKLAAEKRKSFQLDLEEAMTPPPLSLSSPELNSGYVEMFHPLRHSVSSTEILHERAMDRFYQVVALKEAEKVKSKKTEALHFSYEKITEKNVENKIENPVEEKPLKIEETETKTPEVSTDTKVENINGESGLEKRVRSAESLEREGGDSFYDDDYTASTVSTGDSESELSGTESLDREIEILHNRIEENITYHPRDMTKSIPVVTNKIIDPSTRPVPVPLPDPNFIPKPILKKREVELPPEPVPPKTNEPSKSVFKKFAKFPMEKNILGAKKIFSKKTKPVQADISMPKPLEVEKKKEVAETEVYDHQDEGKTVIDHYSNLVREYGGNKKPQPTLYVKTEDLKKAAMENEKKEKKVIKTIPVRKVVRRVVKQSGTEQGKPPNVQVTIQHQPKPQQVIKVATKQPEPKPQPKPEPPKRKTSQFVEKITEEDQIIVITKNLSKLNAKAESNVKTVFNYVIDFSILVVAFWLYFCKDERLAIPFILLTAYRQIKGVVQNYRPPAWITWWRSPNTG